MDNQDKVKKEPSGLLLLITVLVAFAGIVLAIFSLLYGTDGISIFPAISEIVMFLIVLFYVTKGYKIPNNDLVKFCFILFGIVVAVIAVSKTAFGFAANVCLSVSGVLAGYMAGRLKKIEQCKYLSITILFILLACAMLALTASPNTELGAISDEQLSIALKLMAFNPLILWIATMGAYVSRYNQFREIKAERDAKFGDE